MYKCLPTDANVFGFFLNAELPFRGKFHPLLFQQTPSLPVYQVTCLAVWYLQVSKRFFFLLPSLTPQRAQRH